MKPLPFLILSVGLLAACGRRPPVYRAYVKLAVSSTSTNGTTDTYKQFINSQADIMRGLTILKRVEKRLQKQPEEVRNNLYDLNVAPLPNSAVIVVAVDSPSANFAKEFADALTVEYVKFREEQRTAGTDEVFADRTVSILEPAMVEERPAR